MGDYETAGQMLVGTEDYACLITLVKNQLLYEGKKKMTFQRHNELLADIYTTRNQYGFYLIAQLVLIKV